METLISDMELIRQTRDGIDKKSLMELLRSFVNISLKEYASYVHVSVRMIQKKKQDEKLSSRVTEHTLYISKLYREGIEVLGDIKNFSRWMDSPNPSLGGEIPKTYLDTISGVLYLSNHLQGIAHGFPA